MNNNVALGLGPESGTRYSADANGVAAAPPIGPGASSLISKERELFNINKAFKVAELVVDLCTAQARGNWFKVVLLRVELDQVKAATFEPKGGTNDGKTSTNIG